MATGHDATSASAATVRRLSLSGGRLPLVTPRVTLRDGRVTPRAAVPRQFLNTRAVSRTVRPAAPTLRGCTSRRRRVTGTVTPVVARHGRRVTNRGVTGRDRGLSRELGRRLFRRCRGVMCLFKGYWRAAMTRRWIIG